MTSNRIPVRRITAVLALAIAWVLLAVLQASAAQIGLAWDPNPETDIAGYVVEYGPSSAPFTQSVDVGNVTSWTLSSASAGATYQFRVVAYNTGGERSDASASVTATAGGATAPSGPTLAADRPSLVFSFIAGAPVSRTAPQTLRLTQTGAGTVTWTAASNSAWLQVSPASGTGSGALTVSLVPGSAPASGSASASITITATGASNVIAPIGVSLNVLPAQISTAPIGTIDTPANNVAGVTGSLAITGWAIDDVDVTTVRILRDPVAGEAPGALVYIGDATQVEDARPDVATLYPNVPRSYRAGWGYLLLTNMLPSLGTGTFRLYAYADDADGHSTLLGSRTVTCANSSATQPFGAIDTPAPGGTVAGSSYTSFGWVLARGPRRADVPGGGTVNVLIDGTVVGSPSGWAARSDISGLFPSAQFPGVGSAVAAFAFDTTTLANGVHTMAWVVTDNQGGAAGVGSRYFRVFNGAASQVASLTAASTMTQGSELTRAATDTSSIQARRGYDMDAPFQTYAAAADGRVTLQSEELDRIELQTKGATEGFMVSGDTQRPLPIGSRLDPATGTFVWQPGVGFVGSYDLAFVRRTGGRLVRQDVRIVLNPKGSNRVGPQIVVDVAGPIVAGWAADLDSPNDTGIDRLHVWAYPAGGGSPVFVGEASYGGERPDVAAVYGDRFRASGYGLRVEGLAPGAYDLAIFAWSSAKHAWLPAKVVRLDVK
jgi:fibronectin type III domain protein/BACON domain-containing protein